MANISIHHVKLLLAVGLWALVPAVSQAQLANVDETFRNSTAPGFLLGGPGTNSATPDGGRAMLTAPTLDADGQGALRLTSADGGFQSAYALYAAPFSSRKGFSIAFDYLSYGGTQPQGGDGISLFLLDGAAPVTAFQGGGAGGSLGYAQRTAYPASNGGTAAYLGVGIDEFGNFSNPTDGRVGGPGFQPNTVAIRGAGTGSQGYAYLTGAAAVGFTLDSPGTTRPTVGDERYRRALVDVVPDSGRYTITVRIQHGKERATLISRYALTAPPATVRMGFAAGTGYTTNIHEVRNLTISQSAIARNDSAQTLANTPTTLHILANDEAPGSRLDATTIDLDPHTAGQQTSLTVPGVGTFTSSTNTAGYVLFKPEKNFTGTATIPYTVQSERSALSNLAAIRVHVQDVKGLLSLYPNPTQGGNATLELTSLPPQAYSVEIVDAVGRRVQMQRSLQGGAKHVLDVRLLPVGYYVVLVQGESVKVALPLVRT